MRVKQAKKEMSLWIKRYNQERRHYGLDRKTPDHIYFENCQLQLAAA